MVQVICIQKVSQGVPVFQFKMVKINFILLLVFISLIISGCGNEYLNLENNISNESVIILPTNCSLDFELNINKSVLSVLSGGEIIAEASLEIHSPAIFQVVNNSEDSFTKIASLLVRREEKRIVKNIQSNLETEL